MLDSIEDQNSNERTLTMPNGATMPGFCTICGAPLPKAEMDLGMTTCAGTTLPHEAEVDSTPIDAAYEAWCAEREAIDNGLATQLIDCYFCDGGTGTSLRGILSRSLGGDPHDPSVIYHLSCGHKII